MTVEVDPLEVDVYGRTEVSESEIAKGKVPEEHCGLDTSSYHDLSNGSSHCNGKSHCDDGTKYDVNGVSKGDADVSCVFFNGNDAKDGDVVDAELGGKPIGDTSVGSGVSELKMENGKTQLDGQVGDDGVVKFQNGDVGISKREQESFNGDSKATEEVDRTGGSQVNRLEPSASDCESKKFENGKLEVEAEGEESHDGAQFTLKGSDESHTDGVCDGGEKSERERNLESVQSHLEHQESEIALEENVQNVPTSEKEQKVSSNEVYVEGSPEFDGCGDDLQQNSLTVLSSDVDTFLEASNHNNHVLAENANGLPASHEQSSFSEDLDTCQKPAESTGSSVNIESLPSPVMLGDASSAIDQVPTTSPGGDNSLNEILFEGSSDAVGMDLEHSLAILGSELNALETDVSISNAPVFCKSETGDSLLCGLGQDSIPETLLEQNVLSENSEGMKSSSDRHIVIAEDDQNIATPLINNIIVKPDVDAVSLSENLSTCNVEDMKSEVETGKSVEKCSENPEACLTDFSEVAIEADNGAVANDTVQSCSVDHEKSEPKFYLASLEDEVTSDAMNGESRILNSSNDMYGAHADAEIQIFPPVDNEDSLPGSVDDTVKPDSEVEHTFAVTKDIPIDDNIASESSIIPNRTVLDIGNAMDENLKIKSDRASKSSPEGVVHNESNVKNIEHMSAVSRNMPNDDIIAPQSSTIANNTVLDAGSAVGENLKAESDEASKSSPEGVLHIESNVDNIENMSAVCRGILSDDNIAPESNIINSTSLDTGSAVDENLKVESDEASKSSPEGGVLIETNVNNIEHVSAVSRDLPNDDNIAPEFNIPSSTGLDIRSAVDENLKAERGIPNDDNIAPESNIPNRTALYTGSAVDTNLKVESDETSKPSPEGAVQIESNVELTFQKDEGVDDIHKDEASKSSPNNGVEGEDMGPEVVKRPLCFLVRMPRYDDDNIRERIRQAQLQVEEKTKIRDDIRTKIQKKRETCKEYDDIFQAAASKERAARDLLKSKLQEMDSVQFVINKVKDAMSIEDLDGQIRSMEHMIEHETLPLKKEKELIRDINKLKQTRDQISSNMGKDDEVQQALDQKDQIEERMKVLRRDMGVLRENLLKAEEVTQAAKKKLNVEKDGLNELLSMFRAADSIRQEAYIHMHSLKKQLYEKNKYFWKYKEDAKTAYNLASSGDREQLHRLCSEQAETIMELWNKNDDFRKEYIRCNSRNTLRRLRTSDGRSLGPDEEPSVMPNIARERVSKNSSAAQVSTPAQENLIVPPEAEKPIVDKPGDKIMEKKNKTDEAKPPAKVASSINDSAAISGRNDIIEETEERKQTKEEEELARKAEEKRKEEATVRLKEQRRLEEKAKAKEAQERKKRIAEKAQARAAIKAQKEAEEKEKEREKRLKKKEKKKANANVTDATTNGGEGKSVPTLRAEISSGTPKELESMYKPTAVSRRPQKISQLMKQSKPKSIPPPLRNRGKRRIQTWMWVLLTVVVVFALFLVCNTSFSFKSSLQYLGF